jgi:ABC-2 type transport system ATP-binding protein
MTPIIEVNNISKNYGSLRAVDGLSFSANKGEILAMMGPDGAGKTSTFRAVCGLITYDTGEINIAGFDVATQFGKIKPILGYMPQSFSLYPDLTVEENLYFYSGLFGLNKGQFNVKKQILYEFSGLGPFNNRRAGALSGGMKQKLALSCALVHEPQILMLDEPTTGVDPLSRRQFWDILKSLRASGSTIVISTPYMDEVSLSDRAIFIYGGKKIVEGTPDELIRKFTGRVYRVAVNPTPERMDKLNQITGISARRFGSVIHIYTSQDRPIEGFLRELGELGIMPEMIAPIEAGLEDTFIQFMGK